MNIEKLKQPELTEEHEAESDPEEHHPHSAPAEEPVMEIDQELAPESEAEQEEADAEHVQRFESAGASSVQAAAVPIDYTQIDDWMKLIRVRNVADADVEVDNPTPLTMIGKDRKSALFQIGEDRCVKVFGMEQDCNREYYALTLGQDTNLLPRVYSKGSNYIVMEQIKGISLDDYLQTQPLTKEVSLKLIEMLVTFKDIGFKLIDQHKRQIFLLADGTLKVTNVAGMVWRERILPYPRKLLNSLGKDHRDIFLSHVQEMAPKLYEEWQKYMNMDEMARQIYRVVTTQKQQLVEEQASDLAKPLLTTKDEKKKLAKLEGLVRKVYKEEWIKDLIAEGKDPDKVKEEIDLHIEKREMEKQREKESEKEREKEKEKEREQDNKGKETKLNRDIELLEEDGDAQDEEEFDWSLPRKEFKQQKSGQFISKQRELEEVREQLFSYLERKEKNAKKHKDSAKKQGSKKKKENKPKVVSDTPDQASGSKMMKKQIDKYVKKKVEQILKKKKDKPKKNQDAKQAKVESGKSSPKSKAKSKSGKASAAAAGAKNNRRKAL